MNSQKFRTFAWNKKTIREYLLLIIAKLCYEESSSSILIFTWYCLKHTSPNSKFCVLIINTLSHQMTTISFIVSRFRSYLPPPSRDQFFKLVPLLLNLHEPWRNLLKLKEPWDKSIFSFGTCLFQKPFRWQTSDLQDLDIWDWINFFDALAPKFNDKLILQENIFRSQDLDHQRLDLNQYF